MEINTLVATIEQDVDSLLKKMNVYGNVIVSAQNKQNRIREVKNKKFSAKIYEIEGKGVSKNRNLLLMQSNADVLVFADDDLIFQKGYLDIVQKMYKTYNADVILFNLGQLSDSPVNVSKVSRINRLNYQRYGGARITALRSSLVEKGLYFNMMFGGGAPIGSGEDTLFLKQCIDSGLKVIIVPYFLATHDDSVRDSTWFTGYDEKYFKDKGYLFDELHGYKKYIYILRFIIIHKKTYKLTYSLKTMWQWMVEGSKANSQE